MFTHTHTHTLALTLVFVNRRPTRSHCIVVVVQWKFNLFEKAKKANNFRGQRNESFKKLVFPIVSSVSKYKIQMLRKSNRHGPPGAATHTCKGLICVVSMCVQFHPLAATVSQVCMRTVLTYSAWPSSSSTVCTSVSCMLYAADD